MFRPRIIPVLLLRQQVLVKSISFDKHKYIGDPINAVRIFNDLKADELVFLDILATKEKRTVSLSFLQDIGEEANMPFAVGGGINSLKNIQELLNAGAERVIVNSFAAKNPNFIKEASNNFGSSTIVVCIDVKRKRFGGQKVWVESGKKPTDYNPLDYAKLMEEMGAGEIIIQSIERDGLMAGYDLDLISKISHSVTIPVVALGGAGNISHLKEGYLEGFASGLAAGSMFVYHGKNRGVLINYPEKNERNF